MYLKWRHNSNISLSMHPSPWKRKSWIQTIHYWHRHQGCSFNILLTFIWFFLRNDKFLQLFVVIIPNWCLVDQFCHCLANSSTFACYDSIDLSEAENALVWSFRVVCVRWCSGCYVEFNCYEEDILFSYLISIRSV